MLMLAIVLGIASFALMFAFLNSRDSGNGDVERALSGPGAEEVVVAARIIQPGEKITADMLQVETIPGAALLDGRFNTITGVEGQIASSPIYPREQVTTNKITPLAGEQTLAFKVPKGMRAISLQVPHEAWIAAGLPQPGDRIDVLAIATLSRVDPLTGEERPDLAGAYLAQDVEILAVSQTLINSVTPVKDAKPAGTSGSTTDPAATPATGQVETTAPVAADSGKTFESSISITLALTPDLAAKVAMLDAVKDDAAQYRILVRQKGDTDPVAGKTQWSWEDLFPER